MSIADACPECGVVRPPYLGSSHFKKDYYSQDCKPVCRIEVPEPMLGYLGLGYED